MRMDPRALLASSAALLRLAAATHISGHQHHTHGGGFFTHGVAGCFDTDGTTDGDTGHDGCTWYASAQHLCGSYDDADFSARVMCCACGGGSRGSTVPPAPPPCYDLDFASDGDVRVS